MYIETLNVFLSEKQALRENLFALRRLFKRDIQKFTTELRHMSEPENQCAVGHVHLYTLTFAVPEEQIIHYAIDNMQTAIYPLFPIRIATDFILPNLLERAKKDPLLHTCIEFRHIKN